MITKDDDRLVRINDNTVICHSCLVEIRDGDSISLDKDGFFVHMDCGLEYKVIGTYLEGGRVRMI